MRDNLVLNPPPALIEHPLSLTEEMKRRTEDFNIVAHYAAANKDIIKIVNKAKLQQVIYDTRQSLDGFSMTALDYQPAYDLPRDFLDYLPDWLYYVVQKISQEINFDYLTATITSIGVVSTALCGRYIVDCGNIEGWRGEPVSLYMMLIAPPGSSKSALIAIFKNILSEVMEELQGEYDRTVPERRYTTKTKQKVLDKAVNADINAMVKENRANHKIGDFRSLMAEADKFAKRSNGVRAEISLEMPGARPSLFIGDFSLSGLIDALLDQGWHQAFMEDEGMIFEKINGTGLWRERVFIKAYDQAEYSHTKYKKDRHLKPSLNFLLATQPSIARKFFINESHKEQGLAFRFMPILSTSAPYYNADIEPSWWDFFKENLKQLLRKNFTQDSKLERKSIPVERAAVERLLDFQAENQRLAITNPYMEGFLKKLHGMACRIAGVLHLWESSPENPIGLQTVECAIMIARAIIPHAEEVFSPSGFAAVKTAIRIEDWFRKNGNIYAKIHDINNGIGSDVKKRDIEPGLERMMKFNRAAQVFDSNNTPIYVINPQIVPDWRQQFAPEDALVPYDTRDQRGFW